MAYIAITNKNLTYLKIESKNYPKTNLKNIDNGEAIILQLLPFRVRFQNIGLNTANANTPGIGLQIIGINNYIL